MRLYVHPPGSHWAAGKMEAKQKVMRHVWRRARRMFPNTPAKDLAVTVEMLLGDYPGQDGYFPFFRIHGHDAPIHCCAAVESLNGLVTGADDRLLKVWNPETFELRETYCPHDAPLFVYLPGLRRPYLLQLYWRTVTLHPESAVTLGRFAVQ